MPDKQELPKLTPLQFAFNDGVEAAKAAIRSIESDDTPFFINAVARLCNPHGYQTSLANVVARRVAEKIGIKIASHLSCEVSLEALKANFVEIITAALASNAGTGLCNTRAHVTSSPAQEATLRCVKCGHRDGTDSNGWCLAGRPYIANMPDSNQRSICGCHCEFASLAQEDDKQSERWLTEANKVAKLFPDFSWPSHTSFSEAVAAALTAARAEGEVAMRERAAGACTETINEWRDQALVRKSKTYSAYVTAGLDILGRLRVLPPNPDFLSRYEDVVRTEAFNNAIETTREVGRSIASGEEFNEYHGLIVSVIESLEAARNQKAGE